MDAAVAAVEVAAVDVLNVVASRSMPESLFILCSRVARVHFLLLGHVQQVQIRVLDALDLYPHKSTPTLFLSLYLEGAVCAQ